MKNQELNKWQIKPANSTEMFAIFDLKSKIFVIMVSLKTDFK